MGGAHWLRRGTDVANRYSAMASEGDVLVVWLEVVWELAVGDRRVS